jgi:hypothetical protein
MTPLELKEKFNLTAGDIFAVKNAQHSPMMVIITSDKKCEFVYICGKISSRDIDIVLNKLELKDIVLFSINKSYSSYTEIIDYDGTKNIQLGKATIIIN